MSEVFTLLKLFMKGGNNTQKIAKKDSAKKSSSKIGTIVLTVISILFLVAISVLLTYFIGILFVHAQLKWEFVLLATLIVSSLVLILGTIALVSSLFLGKDNQYLFSLPVKSSSIVIAKFLRIYLVDLAVSAALLVPIAVTFGIMADMSVGFYFLILFEVLFIPLLPLTLGVILAVPVMYFVSFLRKYQRLSVILPVVLGAGLMIGYFFLVFGFGSSTGDIDPDQVNSIAALLRSQISPIANSLYYVFFPLGVFAKASVGADQFGLTGALSSFVGVLIALGVLIVLFALAIFLASVLFRKTATKQMENSSAKTKVGSYKTSSVITALILRDVKSIFRSPQMIINSFMNSLMIPIIIAFIAYSIREQTAIAGGMEIAYISIAVMTLFILVFSSLGPMLAFSREGKTISYVFTMPIEPRLYAKAKFIFWTIVSTIMAVICFIIVSCIIFDIVFSLLFLALYLSIATAFNAASIWNDMRSPIINWNDISELNHSRSSYKILITSLVFLAIIVVVGIIGGLTFYAVNDFRTVVIITFCLEIGVFAGFSIFAYNKLMTDSSRFIPRMAEQL